MNQKLGVTWRYVAAHASGMVSMLIVLGVISPDGAQKMVLASQHIYADLHDILGQLAVIYVVVGPSLLAILVKLGFNTTNVDAMIKNLLSIAQSNTPAAQDAKVAIVAAAANPAVGTIMVVNPDVASDPRTPGNVVSAAGVPNPHVARPINRS